MKRGAVAGRASAASFGTLETPPAILSSAEASQSGWPQISPPSWSAAYSREREIAIWITAAASGATSTSSSVTTMLGRSRPPAEHQAEIDDRRDRARDGGGHCHDQRVAVADMGELMRDDARELLPRQMLHQAGRDRDGRIRRVAARGEGVGLRLMHHIDARMGEAGAVG